MRNDFSYLQLWEYTDLNLKDSLKYYFRRARPAVLARVGLKCRLPSRGFKGGGGGSEYLIRKLTNLYSKILEVCKLCLSI